MLELRIRGPNLAPCSWLCLGIEKHWILTLRWNTHIATKLVEEKTAAEHPTIQQYVQMLQNFN